MSLRATLSLLLVASAAAFQPSRRLSQHCGVRRFEAATTSTSSSSSSSSSSASSFDTTALKECLTREYTGFFDPMELEFYDEEVSFVDPLTTLSSVAAYKNNVDLLAGRTPLGAFLFRDAGIELHSVEDMGPGQLRTRWTLEMTMKALPWQPTAYFSGVSDYTVDTARGVIVGQKDYWDSLNLGEGGAYEKKDLLSGLRDFLGQLSPGNPEKSVRQDPAAFRESPPLGILPYSLLRRGRGYDVRRYPASVTAARVRGDASGAQAPTAYGPLGNFLGGAGNDRGIAMQAFGPAITTVVRQAGSSSAEPPSSITTDVPFLYSDDDDDAAAANAPMAAPSSSSESGVSTRELGWSVVAVRRFSPGDPEGGASPDRLVEEHAALLQALRRDGLVPQTEPQTEGEGEGGGAAADGQVVIRRATYDASATASAMPEVWVPLASHDWGE